MNHQIRFKPAFWILSLVLSLTALSLFSGCKKSAPSDGATSDSTQTSNNDAIWVGEVGSLTGSEATFGTSTHQGLMLAIDEINQQGGFQGKRFEVRTLDDQGKPDEAATAVTRLITQDKVIAIIGEVASSKSLAMAPIAQNFKVPMITPSSTNPKVTEVGDYIFRVCFIDPFQGTVMAKFAHETLKAKNVAVLKDVKNDYSVGLSSFFIQTFKKLGGNIVAEQSYSAGDIDFKAQLTSLRAKKPEAIFVPGYYTEVGLIARQAKELGLQVPLLGGDGWDSPKLTEIGGNAINGSYFSNHYTSEDSAPHVRDFIKRFDEKWGVIPDGLAALGYDAGKILYDAVKRAGTTSGPELKKAIAETKDFQGVTGKITLDQNRNPVKSAVVLKIVNGAFKYQTTVQP